MARRIGDLVVGRRHPDFGAADRAPVHEPDLAELTSRRRLGDRPNDASEHARADLEDEVTGAERQRDPEERPENLASLRTVLARETARESRHFARQKPAGGLSRLSPGVR